MPHIQTLHEELKAAGRDDVVILAFNAGIDTPEVAKGLWDDEGFGFDAVMDEAGQDGANSVALGVRIFPANFVIDPDGVVRFVHVGFDEGVEEQIRGLLDLD